MANKTITMNKLRQILRLYTQQKGKKFISGQTGVARNTIKKYIGVFKQLRMSFQELNELTDQQLNELFGKKEETIEVSIAIPAEGPSLGVAPSGTCTWIFFFSMSS